MTLAIVGGVIVALALIGILAAYLYAEVKTPGFGWGDQVDEPAEQADRELAEQAQREMAGRPGSG